MSNLIQMKHARILYNEELNEATRKYEITDLVVAEFNLDDFHEIILAQKYPWDLIVNTGINSSQVAAQKISQQFPAL